MKTNRQQGFTIIELMIASTAFSMILLLCTMGLIQIGRMYYRGVVASRTQESARAVMDDMSQAIQFSGSDVREIGQSSDSTTQGFCIGSRRYSYRLTAAPGTTDTKPALVVDDNPSECGLGGARAQSLTDAVPDIGRNLLGDNMRLLELSPPTQNPLGSSLYRVSLTVVYGNDIIDPDGVSGPLPLECKALRLGGQFCAISGLSTTVQKRI